MRAVTAALVWSLVATPADAATGAARPPVPERGRLLVSFDDTRAMKAPLGQIVKRMPGLALQVVDVPDMAAASRLYARLPGVRAVEPDAPVKLSAADPLYTYQWHLKPLTRRNRGTANVEPAWDTAKGKGVRVAVVDTGVRRGGNDLHRRRVLRGWDFVGNDRRPNDPNGHGTHIAGTIAQATRNGVGVAGVAPKSKILPVRVLDKLGNGTYSRVIEGMLWASRRADVVNLSLAGATPSRVMCDAVAKAAKRALVVVSAGNTAGKVGYPAACRHAVAVGAVRYDGKRAPYSNKGRSLDLVAPGGDNTRDQNDDGYGDSVLQQTYDDKWAFRFFEGTSMAAAHVSGVAALVLDAYPDANVRRVLMRSARDLGPDGRDRYYGKGAVDAAAAVAIAAFQAERAD